MPAPAADERLNPGLQVGLGLVPETEVKIMDDKRRRARVQGGWAGPVKSRAASRATPEASLARNNVTVGTGQAWMRREQLLLEKPYIFKESTKMERKAPETRVIDKQGLYEISTSPTGASRINLIPGFIDSKEADWMFEQLLQEIPWGQRTHIRQDLSFEEPRLTSWYGELPYTYSRLTMNPNPHWHPLLTSLKKHIEEVTSHTFNSLLCNLYRNEKDSVDWHSDDELSLGRNPVIASLSFGATRVFEMRKKPTPEESGDYTYVERIRIPLDHGTLLMMEGATQEDWQHRVPKEYHAREARINLTFRTIYTGHEGF
ncbi:alpha-ketoglutarate-dependent dioxygenase alkB-like protein 3 isoform A [Alligator mississippiensis]|uniref:Alpha-ketoglutarate-dependent dioxygenase alkB homolog 3 n=1 Tax=Alligator mississippiensis TaxID=8496 RepID=A0A151MBE5_ALLMI|nr:alpha-ketoglutarate-dependent dioxygenase alkB-like protein 3 isoform A [Alligator mississippiensis]